MGGATEVVDLKEQRIWIRFCFSLILRNCLLSLMECLKMTFMRTLLV